MPFSIFEIPPHFICICIDIIYVNKKGEEVLLYLNITSPKDEFILIKRYQSEKDKDIRYRSNIA